MGGSEKKKKKDKEPKTPESTPMKVDKADDEPEVPELDYEVLVGRVNAIATPLASKKLTKKTLKSVKKAAKAKSLRRGVKEVVKALRKGEKGFVVIAGDISPIDVISHLPVLCEDSNTPYAYVPAKQYLGAAGGTKRPTSCVMVKKSKEVDNYSEVRDEIKALTT